MTFWSPSWRSLNLWKGHLTIPKRSQRIAMVSPFCVSSFCLDCSLGNQQHHFEMKCCPQILLQLPFTKTFGDDWYPPQKSTKTSLFQSFCCEDFGRSVTYKSTKKLYTFNGHFGKIMNPSLPNTSWEGVLGMFLGSKYLLTRCLEA